MNEPILQGKVKSVYDVDGDAQKVIIEFHDKVTAWNGKHVEYPEEKGATCCLISALLFEMLEREGIKTHYLDLLSLNTMVCRKLTIIPVEVIVRNIDLFLGKNFVRIEIRNERLPDQSFWRHIILNNQIRIERI